MENIVCRGQSILQKIGPKVHLQPDSSKTQSIGMLMVGVMASQMANFPLSPDNVYDGCIANNTYGQDNYV